jgi:hypothetical protein
MLLIDNIYLMNVIVVLHQIVQKKTYYDVQDE